MVFVCKLEFCEYKIAYKNQSIMLHEILKAETKKVKEIDQNLHNFKGDRPGGLSRVFMESPVTAPL